MRITACPSCGTSFSITEEQLGFDQGRVKCGQCGRFFNANENIKQDSSEQEIKDAVEETVVEVYPNSPEDLGNQAPSHLSKSDNTENIFSFDLKESLNNENISNILHPRDYLSPHKRDLAKKEHEDFKKRKPNKKFLDLIDEIESKENDLFENTEKTKKAEDDLVIDHFAKALEQTKKEKLAQSRSPIKNKTASTQNAALNEKEKGTQESSKREPITHEPVKTKNHQEKESKTSSEINLEHEEIFTAQQQEQNSKENSQIDNISTEETTIEESQLKNQEEQIERLTQTDLPNNQQTISSYEQEKLSDSWAFGACIATLVVLIGQLIFFPIIIAMNKSTAAQNASSSVLIKNNQLSVHIETAQNLNIETKPTLYITFLDKNHQILINKAFKAAEYQPYIKMQDNRFIVDLSLKIDNPEALQTMKVGWHK